MGQGAAQYRIRLARLDELPRLRDIEDRAGTMFSGLGLIEEALDVSYPPEELRRLIGLRQVWVAFEADDVPVGMVIASVRDGSAHIDEMDVLPAHGGRGLGTLMLDQACAWAQAQGYSAVTLSTFRDVPWNGPFYTRTAFELCRRASGLPPCAQSAKKRPSMAACESRRECSCDASWSGIPLVAACRYGWRGKLAASMKSSRSIGRV
jgi:GNAT superfamily N-acetyltransferase